MVKKTSVSRYRAMVAVSAITTLVLGAGCTSMVGIGSGETVVIAADLELSGEGAELGNDYHNALRLMVEQVNEQGRLGDRELALRVRDNRSDRATAANNISELMADPGVVALITGSCYECLFAAMDVIDDAGVPTIALAAPDAVSKPVEERRNVFKLSPNAADTASALIGELSRAKGMQTLGLVVVDDAYGDDGLQELTGAADRAGLEVVVEERIATEEDSVSVATRVADWQPEGSLTEPALGGQEAEESTGPDAVVLWAYPHLATEVASNLRSAGYEGQLYLDASAARDLFLTGPVGGALDGATMVFTETLVIDQVIATSPAKAARKTWFQDYTAKYGSYSAYASFAADAVRLVVEAVNRFDSTDRETVRTAIESIQIDGLTGPIRMTPDRHSGLMPQALTTLVARGDRWRLAT